MFFSETRTIQKMTKQKKCLQKFFHIIFLIFKTFKIRPLACNFIKKETLAQVFSCKFGEISKNIFSYRTPPGDCFCNNNSL